MQFILSWNNNEDVIILPVRPSNFEINTSNLNTTVNITSVGEHNLIGRNALATTTIESFFPGGERHYTENVPFTPPYDHISMIQKWKESRRPIRVIITDTPINYAMSIESFTYGEQDGSGDVYYTLELKEYKFITNNIFNVATTTRGNIVNTPITKRETKPIETELFVEIGTSASSVAKKMTGTTSNKETVITANAQSFELAKAVVPPSQPSSPGGSGGGGYTMMIM